MEYKSHITGNVIVVRRVVPFVGRINNNEGKRVVVRTQGGIYIEPFVFDTLNAIQQFEELNNIEIIDRSQTGLKESEIVRHANTEVMRLLKESLDDGD